MPAPPIGIIEGFYGTPWTWTARAEIARWCHERGLSHYVYAPKDDPKHREHWRDPYDAGELAAFERFSEEGTLRLGFAISPGLSMDPQDRDDRAALATKVDQVLAVGAASVVLALDDIPFGGGPQGEEHAELCRWLLDHLDGRADLALVPTEYVGLAPSPYLDALATGVPPEVPIGWTGTAVVNDAITVAHARARAASVGDRPPLLWDNFPVNDALMVDRLFLGPLRGREQALLDECAGYFANPMVQPRASRLPLASVAAWARGQDPEIEWERCAADLGWRAFAMACDSRAAHHAVDHALTGDTAAAREYFGEAAVATAPGIEDEVEPWREQVERDARLALDALEVLDGDRDVRRLIGLALGWQASRRAAVTVFGPRCSVRPVLAQAADGAWRMDRASVQADDNPIDVLVRAALDALVEEPTR